MAVVTYNVHALAVKGMDGYGHAERALAKSRQLGCDIIGLQDTRRSEKTEVSAAGLSKRKQKAGKDCTELGW